MCLKKSCNLIGWEDFDYVTSQDLVCGFYCKYLFALQIRFCENFFFGILYFYPHYGWKARWTDEHTGGWGNGPEFIGLYRKARAQYCIYTYQEDIWREWRSGIVSWIRIEWTPDKANQKTQWLMNIRWVRLFTLFTWSNFCALLWELICGENDTQRPRKYLHCRK